jgi:hypothetical protein
MADEQYAYDNGGQQGDAYYPPGMQNSREKADLLDKIRPDEIVEILRHKFLGEDFVNGEWVKNKYVQDKALSPMGAWQMANLMLGVSSQNVALSNLKEGEIRARTMGIIKAAQYMLLKNWKEYGIKGVDQLHFVHQIVLSNTFITLKQPENAGIRRLIMGTQTELHQYSNFEQKSGGSWWSKLLGGKK